jgi:hypothetical protein
LLRWDEIEECAFFGTGLIEIVLLISVPMLDE